MNPYMSIVVALFVIATVDAAWFLNPQYKFVTFLILLLSVTGYLVWGHQ